MLSNKGFTLVEILIVVIILGILAAIVIPQFTEASNDARESALASDLQTLRSQIELYKIQHLDKGPNLDENDAADNANFVARLTGKTDQDGKINANGAFGPYLQSFPSNPFVSGAGNDPDGVTVASGDPSGNGDDSTGWYYNTDNGKISPYDNDGHDSM